MQEDDTHQIVVKIPQEEIVFVDQVFKSYSGLAQLTISQEEDGLVYLDVTNTTHDQVLEIIKDLKNKFSVEIIKE